ncbi:CDP-glycerol--glycerophosphate glycerophosphotransferase [Ancylomarina euxinus]|uniref:CDP-glycerol--glycerophosphate glycerophosphotransferase n=1 Tax=Ancylomarina euxinus TaxID=2283627 RepID=A0A425Y1M0_9BACT|nr:CDP-glycerol glycerophosphotransferase family protein [Ancylomarina euxinus]MCZ4695112.1 CDP-glycerol glycerophosphotransferase family protein [Ancylomarina euxinus]MUP14952.1 CDP-glycerol--glycerophosphate glycerophosphotransferase [Ancylomarina euxinus]RRG21844.1 CDP-glycerol--glycerophosphate glycerophosphotransferase [Ancylomarina euxinus]
MKTVLFCKRPYSFSILRPIHNESIRLGDDVMWYIDPEIVDRFPFKEDSHYTTSLQEIYDFKSDAIFVPGNVVPHYLRGVKTQIFHGLAGEKKGHFRIRNYFDLYLTQGPYFTNRFNELASKHGDFDVMETGWSKLDDLFLQKENFNTEKTNLLEKHEAKEIILYAPTFSPSLTSAEVLSDEIIALSKNKDYLIMVKFHDLMNEKVKALYHEIARSIENIVILDDPNISKYLILSDLMISDTSSVVYEFLLLDKPVITFKSSSDNIKWTNIETPDILCETVGAVMNSDINQEERKWIINNYHPLRDGKSAQRMIEAVKQWLSHNSVPEKRKLSFLRKWKVNKKYGKVKK